MIKVRTNKHGEKFVAGVVTLKINGYLPEGIKDEEISEQRAKELVKITLDHYSGSNDGSELLMNVNDNEISFL